jgi:hypothetical protein
MTDAFNTPMSPSLPPRHETNDASAVGPSVPSVLREPVSLVLQFTLVRLHPPPHRHHAPQATQAQNAVGRLQVGCRVRSAGSLPMTRTWP